jgi:ubiquinone/menaquinone biosynthesis C-methylase UbiE
VVYGGPISYAFDQAPVALAECIRVTRPGGVVLGSVMSTIGSFRWFLPGVAEEIKTFGIEAMDTCCTPGTRGPLKQAATAAGCSGGGNWQR